jgi:metal-sulfur cluster biosynthetic enzyme
MSATKEQIIERLSLIIDPEVDMDIYSLGLVYTIDIKDEKTLELLITYTSPACPAGPQIQQAIQDEMESLGFEHTTITITFDPPWEMPEVVKVMFGLA